MDGGMEGSLCGRDGLVNFGVFRVWVFEGGMGLGLYSGSPWHLDFPSTNPVPTPMRFWLAI